MTKFVAVFITAGSMDEAGRIAEKLIDERKAACVNILSGSIKSLFWWKGRKETCEEVLLIAKSRIEILDEVEKAVKEEHSSEVPEIIALPIAGGSGDYLKWLGREIR